MLPEYKDIDIPLLRELLRRGGQSRPSGKDQQGLTVYESLADHFDLTDKERNSIIIEDGRDRSKWSNMVQWSRRHLKDQGQLDSPSRGVWRITTSGRDEVESFYPSKRPSNIPPEELDESDLDTGQSFVEGALAKITVNSYERSQKARTACIKHHGYYCAACGFDFEKKYGSVGADYIHVHHLKLISTVTEAYVVDHVNDLIPVCANCHAIIHRKRIPYTIDEVKEMIAKQELA